MTKKRMLELLLIERECVMSDCDRNCAACSLVQEQDELVEMYTHAYYIIKDCLQDGTDINEQENINGVQGTVQGNTAPVRSEQE